MSKTLLYINGRQNMSERVEQHMAALRLGIEIVSLVDNMPDFVRPLVKDFKVVDTMDYDSSVKCAIDLHRIHNFCGIVNWSEKDVPLRNIIAHKLNLPHMDRDNIARCRDKVEMRGALSAIAVFVLVLARLPVRLI